MRQKIVNQWIARTMTLQYRVGEWSRDRGRPVPAAIRRVYFLVNHAEAERKYRPGVYPGSMVIFETQGLFHDPNLGWERLVAGNLEVHAIPGEHRPGGHRDLLKGDFVRAVSSELTRLLAAAADPRRAVSQASH